MKKEDTEKSEHWISLIKQVDFDIIIDSTESYQHFNFLGISHYYLSQKRSMRGTEKLVISSFLNSIVKKYRKTLSIYYFFNITNSTIKDKKYIDIETRYLKRRVRNRYLKWCLIPDTDTLLMISYMIPNKDFILFSSKSLEFIHSAIKWNENI